MMHTKMRAARLALSTAVMLVAATSAARAQDPAANGPLATRSERFAITVQGRKTSIDIRLPAAASFARPVVVICHGWGYSISNYESIAEHLASRGFAAVLYSQPDILGTSTQGWANQMKDAIGELARLDAKTSSPVFGELDMNALGIMGHSYGGACVTMLAAQDPRVKVTVALAPVNQWHWSAVLANAAQIRTPFLLLAGSSDWLATTGYTRPLYAALARSPEREHVEVAGAGHVFPIGGGAQARLASRYYTSWLERFLMKKADPAGWTDGRKAKEQEQQGVLTLSEHAGGAPSPAAAAPPPPRSGAFLRRGSTGPDVVALQRKLQALGLYQGAIDGDFGPATEKAVTDLQRQKGLAADGVVGPATRSVLGI